MVDTDTLVSIAAAMTIADYAAKFIRWLYQQWTKPRYRPKHLRRK